LYYCTVAALAGRSILNNQLEAVSKKITSQKGGLTSANGHSLVMLLQACDTKAKLNVKLYAAQMGLSTEIGFSTL